MKILFFLILVSNVAMAQKGTDRTLTIAGVTFTDSKDHKFWQPGRSDVSLGDFLDHPILTTGEEGRITGYLFGIRTSDGDYKGPFDVRGSKLTPEIKRTLKAYQGTRGTVFIESIKVWLKSEGIERVYSGAIQIKYAH